MKLMGNLSDIDSQKNMKKHNNFDARRSVKFHSALMISHSFTLNYLGKKCFDLAEKKEFHA